MKNANQMPLHSTIWLQPVNNMHTIFIFERSKLNLSWSVSHLPDLIGEIFVFATLVFDLFAFTALNFDILRFPFEGMQNQN